MIVATKQNPDLNELSADYHRTLELAAHGVLPSKAAAELGVSVRRVQLRYRELVARKLLSCAGRSQTRSYAVTPSGEEMLRRGPAVIRQREKFTRPASDQRCDRVLRLFFGRAEPTPLRSCDVAEAFAITRASAADLLRYMAERGELRCVGLEQRAGAGTKRRLYMLASGGVVRLHTLDGLDWAARAESLRRAKRRAA